MNTRAIAAAVVLSILTACGSTELAVQSAPPALSALGMKTTDSFSFTNPVNDLVNPCTGEALRGFVTYNFVVTMVKDASGGIHAQVDATVSSTFMGDRGTTFTEAGTEHRHFNLPSSGSLNFNIVNKTLITGSDGTAFTVMEHVVVVFDANMVLRVERENVGGDPGQSDRCVRH